MKKKDLADKADTSTCTISRLNKGGNVNADTLARICQAPGCSFDDIMELTDDETKH